jgi:hypothetical protein
MMNMKIDGNFWLLRCTGKNSQKQNAVVWLMPTKTASNASYFKQSRSAA